MEASGFTKSKLYCCHKLLTVPALQKCLYSEMVTAPCEPDRDGPWNIVNGDIPHVIIHGRTSPPEPYFYPPGSPGT
jgi:hypothetical protein